MSYIGLIDCNNFFVSCERLFRPDLKDKPTIVLSSNDGCVVARSQEVKDMGIPMGIPYFQIKDDLKKHSVTIFSGNLTLYRDISARVMRTLEAEVGEIEQYSVDEAFFNFSMPEKNITDYLQAIKEQIETKVGVPISVGAAKTKTIAKYASEHEKRGKGYCFLTGDTWKHLSSSVPIHEIWGVGGKTSQKLSGLGIKTVADFIALDRARVDKLFGVGGLRIQTELSEVPVHGSKSDRELQKSFMSTRSFEKNVFDLSKLEAAVAYHVNHVAADLRKQNLEAQAIRVLARPSRHGDWALQGASAECMLPAPTNDTRVILSVAEELLHSIYKPNVPYKKVGVIMSYITSAEGRTESLFTLKETTKEASTVMTVIDRLNQKLGKGTVKVGSFSQGSALTKSKWRSPNFTTKWADIPIIKT